MKNDKATIKKNRFERLVTLSLLLAFILVIITGVLSFIRLNNIIFTVNNTIRPDRRLSLVKEIYSDLIQAENSVKSYTLTREEEDMTHFYEIAEITGGKMDELKQQVKKDISASPYIDSLDILVEEKFTVLDQLLINRDELLVKKAMDEVMKNITIEKQAEAEPGTETETQTQLQPGQAADTIAEEKPAKKDNFFTRLFRKKKTEEEQAPDTIKPAEPQIDSVAEEPAVEMVRLKSSVRKCIKRN
jgi:CHASE3 domain sensor protein